MFNYKTWSAWLEEKATELQLRGFETCFNRADGTPKHGSSLGASSKKVMGLFAMWETGEADHDILDGQGKSIDHNWGMLLTDHTFVAAFDKFTDILVEVESQNSP